MAKRIRVALLVFDEVDLLDVGGPYEVFLTANRLAERRGKTAPFEVVTVAAESGLKTSYGGLDLAAQQSFDVLGDDDVLIVPGAIDIVTVLKDEQLLRMVSGHAQRGLVASVCTGAFILAAAGVLDGRPFTTHWEDVGDLAERVRGGEPRADVRWVDDGNIVTSGGLSSGIAMALHLVARLVDPDLAQATADQIDYVWTERRG
ncbi:DJ-1/PfpI family protein [Actinobacteria bacterium YIM 96077]|uniref:DJ-1/PfpI family protein n=1 Tax=Phytoactinopolyspora halophila TaxID=1981511 RepID=A0A329QRZ7_9ACTN|nr:DJ-1/PfpI family protein [Phytoactinopolyspora halophila]AYY15075.1 DJ-1/PfpI family protein [Actinobacteria bacterium YIM 96077]RAW14162.1 DJ-1/PfpI family protein [Phytoactinopolyspora halophila]